MMKKKVVILNRSFWPDSKILGESMLQIAETLTDTYDVEVITQSTLDLKHYLDDQGRAIGVTVNSLVSAPSGRSLFFRLGGLITYAAWIAIMLVKIRPSKVYATTNPPIIGTFLVALYAKLFRAQYIYLSLIHI